MLKMQDARNKYLIPNVKVNSEKRQIILEVGNTNAGHKEPVHKRKLQEHNQRSLHK